MKVVREITGNTGVLIAFMLTVTVTCICGMLAGSYLAESREGEIVEVEPITQVVIT